MANILVVDDEMGIRELLSEILSDEGHAVLTAENAQQAREFRQNGVQICQYQMYWMVLEICCSGKSFYLGKVKSYSLPLLTNNLQFQNYSFNFV